MASACIISPPSVSRKGLDGGKSGVFEAVKAPEAVRGEKPKRRELLPGQFYDANGRLRDPFREASRRRSAEAQARQKERAAELKADPAAYLARKIRNKQYRASPAARARKLERQREYRLRRKVREAQRDGKPLVVPAPAPVVEVKPPVVLTREEQREQDAILRTVESIRNSIAAKKRAKIRERVEQARGGVR